VAQRLVPGIPGHAGRFPNRNPHAMLSGGGGNPGRTLIVNLPGSPKGARENLAAVAAALPHAWKNSGQPGGVRGGVNQSKKADALRFPALRPASENFMKPQAPPASRFRSGFGGLRRGSGTGAGGAATP